MNHSQITSPIVSGRLLAAFLTIFLGLTVVSCSKDEEDANDIDPIEDIDILDGSREPLPPKEYTIMFYGHGGGNLDQSILLNLRQMYEAKRESFNKVNVVVQYKNSANPSSLAGIQKAVKNFDFHRGSTYRYALDPSKGYNKTSRPNMQLTNENLYGVMKSYGNLVNMGVADTLANFMRWAKLYFPAKKYILVLADHGGGYRPHDDLPDAKDTRGVIYDDGFFNVAGDKSHLTVMSLSRAIERSGLRPTAIYFDACLMNNFETLYEIAEQTDYILASTYMTPSMGGTYGPFIDCLAANSNIEEALKAYHKELRTYWQAAEAKNPIIFRYHDNSIVSTKLLLEAAPKLKAFVDLLVKEYQKGINSTGSEMALCDLIDTKVSSKVLKMHPIYPYYEMEAFLMLISDKVYSMNSTLGTLATDAFKKIFDSRISMIGTNYTETHWNPGSSVLMGDNGIWNEYEWILNTDPATMAVQKYRISTLRSYVWDGNYFCYNWNTNKQDYDLQAVSGWGSTGDQTYAQLKFDKLVGWSRWIKLNRWCPKELSPTLNNSDFFDDFLFDDGDNLDDVVE